MTETLPDAQASVLGEPYFRRYLVARALSVAGSSASFVAMPLLVHDLTGSALLTSLVVSINGVVYLLLGLPVGAVCDRLDRWRLMIWADVVRALALLTVPVVAYTDALTSVHLFAVIAFSSALFVLFDAANLGFLTNLIGKERLAAAHGTTGSVTATMEIVGPALIGIVIAVAGPAMAIGFDAVTYLASAVLISRIRIKGGHRAVTGISLKVLIGQGLTLVWRDPCLRRVMAILLALALAEGAYFGQYVPLSLQRLGIASDDARFGLLVTSMGIGTLIGSATLGYMTRKLGSTSKLIAVAAPLSGLLAFGVVFATHWVVACSFLVIWAVLYMWGFMAATVARQQRAGLEYQSRVSTLGRMACLGIGVPTGAFAAGVLAEATSPVTGVSTVMLCSLMAVCVAAWRVVGTDETPAGEPATP